MKCQYWFRVYTKGSDCKNATIWGMPGKDIEEIRQYIWDYKCLNGFYWVVEIFDNDMYMIESWEKGA